MTLPGALYGWLATPHVDVYTDTHEVIGSKLDAAAGKALVGRVPPSAKYVVTDYEDALEGPREKLHVTRLNAANRDLKQPVSAYSNVTTNYYWARAAHIRDLARRGVAGLPTIPSDVPEVSEAVASLVRPLLLAPSAWAVFHAYPIDDYRDAWDDVAVIYQMAAVCRAATTKPVVVYLSPRESKSTDMTDTGKFVSDERWAVMCVAAAQACDAAVFYGSAHDIPAKDVDGYWKTLSAL